LQFGEWWDVLDDEARVAINAVVLVLERLGPALTRPYADTVKGSRHPNMRGASRSASRSTVPIALSFDPRRTAIILVGGDKGGNDRWYDVNIPIADKLYDEHLQEIKNETKPNEVE
jgi:hypothetical protein